MNEIIRDNLKDESDRNGVVFAIFKEDEILLEERLNPDAPFYGLIIIPGGGIEEGEFPPETVFREIQEECGIIPKSVVFAGMFGESIIRFVFILKDKDYDGEIVNNEPRKARHIIASLDKARQICTHSITHKALDIVESYLENN